MNALLRAFVKPHAIGTGRIGLRLFVACVFLAGCVQFGLRVRRTPLEVDEAESAINALSILEHGYPGDRHLGIPIYENMLVRPWPESSEYEFKDVSYTDRGFAIYHGWLPLYAIAGSFRLFGISAPQPVPGWQIDIDLSRFKWRTMAARAPSLVFGVLLLLALFKATHRLGGVDAALAVLILAGQSNSIITAAVFARYYVLTLLLSTLGWLTLWQVITRARRRDYIAHALILLMLFYTQLLAFLTLVILTTVAIFLWSRSWLSVRRMSVVYLAVAALALPWLVLTGLLQHLRYMPSGRPLLDLPGDLVNYALDRVAFVALLGAGALWTVWLMYGFRAEPSSLDEERRNAPQYGLLWLWMLVAVCLWCLATPAASVFPQRLSLSLFVPALILCATVIANVSRMIAPSGAVILAPLLAYLFLAIGGVLHFPPPEALRFEKLAYTFEALNKLDLKPDAKVYAAPGTQLVLSFYSDKPVQSLAPIRKTFLDAYPGEVVCVENRLDWEYAAPSARDLQRAASDLREPLDDESAHRWELQLRTRFAREQTITRVAEVVPPLEQLPPFAETAMVDVRKRAGALADEEAARWAHVPFARGFRLRSSASLWQVFFYRLVDPDSRRGNHLNAAERLRQGQAYFIPQAQVVVFYSPQPLLP